jgi:hypothetical protein
MDVRGHGDAAPSADAHPSIAHLALGPPLGKFPPLSRLFCKMIQHDSFPSLFSGPSVKSGASSVVKKVHHRVIPFIFMPIIIRPSFRQFSKKPRNSRKK